MMSRDNLFWFAVGALAIGTAVLSARHTIAATEAPPEAVVSGSTTPTGARPETTTRASAARHVEPSRIADDASSRAPARSRAAPAARAANAGWREALVEQVRASRSGRPRAGASHASASADAAELPFGEMSFEQYRLWAKLGSLIAERDYRAVEQLHPTLTEQFDESIVDDMIETTLADYRSYLLEVVEQSCQSFEPESVWRKVAFMTIWTGALERSSLELGAAQQAALSACDF